MIAIPGFEIQRTLYHGNRSTVLDAVDLKSQEPRVLKFYHNAPTQGLRQLQTEFEIAKQIPARLTCEMLELRPFADSQVLVMRPFEGQNLRDQVQQPMELGTFLQLAIELSQCLGAIHALQVVHKDISPSNLLWSQRTGEVRIIDFGHASQGSRDTFTGEEAQQPLTGTLPYISPECTGRINRRVDYRTDIYSLGVVFYQLLCGRLPFTETDTLKLVQAHLSAMPPPLNLILPTVPPLLTRIVLKMLEKRPEDRYQSLAILARDLDLCLAQFRESGKVGMFAIAEGDISSFFQLSQQLYGRETQIRTLHAALARVNQGAFEIVMLAGDGGSGKTSLAREIQAEIHKGSGFFLVANHDQMLRERPYSAFLDAITQLLTNLLALPEAELSLWRQRLATALDNEGNELKPLLPLLSQFVTLGDPDLSLEPEERQHRFHRSFQRLLLCLPSPRHPVVFFLDNLQWTDPATLMLLEFLGRDTTVKNLMIVGTYRDNEVSPSHPLRFSLENLRKIRQNLEVLHLPPLNSSNIAQLLMDSLAVPRAKAIPLATLCMRKTEGNPFFLHHFLNDLHAQGLLTFDYSAQAWQWKIEELESLSPTDNVVHYMLEKTRKLSAATQDAMHWASCLGSKFSLNLLSMVMEMDLVTLQGHLQQAERSDLIYTCKSSWNGAEMAFHHDRVRHACANLVTPAVHGQRHLHIARFLLTQSQPVSNTFHIIAHFQHCLELLDDRSERRLVLELYLDGAHKAMVATAHRNAYELLNQASSLLEESFWNEERALMVRYHILATQSSRLCGELAAMNRSIGEVLLHDIPLQERLPIEEEYIQYLVSSNNLSQALERARSIFSGLGLELPARPNALHATKELIIAHWKLGKHPAQKLANLPEMRNDNMLVVMRVASRIASGVFILNPYLFVILVLRLTLLSLRYGHSPYSPWYYTLLALVYCSLLKKIPAGAELGKLARSLSHQDYYRVAKAKILFNYNTQVRPYTESVGRTIDDFSEGYKAGIECGDHEFATHCLSVQVYHQFFQGQCLTELCPTVDMALDSMRNLQQDLGYSFSAVYRQAIHHLQNDTDFTNPWNGPWVELERDIQSPLQQDNHHMLAVHCMLSVQMGLLYETGKPMLSYTQEMKKHIHSVQGFIIEPEFLFVEAMAYMMPALRGQDRAKVLLSLVRANTHKLAERARFAPDNFQGRLLLLQACQADLQGHTLDALTLYDQARAEANRCGHVWLKALICRCVAGYWQRHEKAELSYFYVHLEIAELERWGAHGLAENVRMAFGQSLAYNLANPASPANSKAKARGESRTSTSGPEAIDFQSVIKACNMFSEESRPAALIEKSLELLLENAGGNRGILLHMEQDELYVQGKIDLTCQPALRQTLQHIPMLQEAQMAHSIALTVLRTRQAVLWEIENGLAPYAQDPHIVKSRPHSVICLPILGAQKLLGVLYIENTLTSQAFTPRRERTLTQLLNQISLSLENSLLRQQLTQRPVMANRHNSVGVFYADIVDLSQKVSDMPSQTALKELGDLLEDFDSVMTAQGAERIHTMGNGYLAVVGISESVPFCAVRLIEASFAILDTLRKRNASHAVQWEIRIGIHCGSMSTSMETTQRILHSIYQQPKDPSAESYSAMRIVLTNPVAECIRHLYDLEERRLSMPGQPEQTFYFVNGRINSTAPATFRSPCQQNYYTAAISS